MWLVRPSEITPGSDFHKHNATDDNSGTCHFELFVIAAHNTAFEVLGRRISVAQHKLRESLVANCTMDRRIELRGLCINWRYSQSEKSLLGMRIAQRLCEMLLLSRDFSRDWSIVTCDTVTVLWLLLFFCDWYREPTWWLDLLWIQQPLWRQRRQREPSGGILGVLTMLFEKQFWNNYIITNLGWHKDNLNLLFVSSFSAFGFSSTSWRRCTSSPFLRFRGDHNGWFREACHSCGRGDFFLDNRNWLGDWSGKSIGNRLVHGELDFRWYRRKLASEVTLSCQTISGGWECLRLGNIRPIVKWTRNDGKVRKANDAIEGQENSPSAMRLNIFCR